MFKIRMGIPGMRDFWNDLITRKKEERIKGLSCRNYLLDKLRVARRVRKTLSTSAKNTV